MKLDVRFLCAWALACLSCRATYWKSQPKKFCEACKCWFADNKASIDFHEKGKNHQANVQQRIKDIMKKGKKMYKAQQNYENMMDQINQAALKAFERDVETGGSKTAKLQYAAEQARLKERAEQRQEEAESTSSSQVKTWFEATSPEGETYYWNSESGESIWEKPASGYISLAEQQAVVSDVDERTTFATQEDEGVTGPKPRGNPYGDWEEVKPKVVPDIDLQLPEKPQDVEEVVISISQDVPTKVKFLEKTVGSVESCGEGDSVFKKRKIGGRSARNVRQRTDED
ncbi:unnamed protein product [Ixodes pacificus]